MFKTLMITLAIFCSLNTHASRSDDALNEIKNVIDSSIGNIDKYHYGRLKGYLEGLGLKEGFVIDSSLESDRYRMSLVSLKKIFENFQANYKEQRVTSVIKKISVLGTRNSLGSCQITKQGEMKISIREFTGEKFNSYTMPIIEKCSIDLINLFE